LGGTGSRTLSGNSNNRNANWKLSLDHELMRSAALPASGAKQRCICGACGIGVSAKSGWVVIAR
jgi:hypothetical protein